MLIFRDEHSVIDVGKVGVHVCKNKKFVASAKVETVWICTVPFSLIETYLERTYEKLDLKKGGVEIGKAMAEKSKGLFSADDWQCKTYVIFY